MGFEGPTASEAISEARTGLIVSWAFAFAALFITTALYCNYRKQLLVSRPTLKRISFERIVALSLVTAWASSFSLLGLRSAFVWEVVVTVQKAIAGRSLLTLIMLYCDENQLRKFTSGKARLHIKLLSSLLPFLSVIAVGLLVAITMGLSSATAEMIFGIANPLCTVPFMLSMGRLMRHLGKENESERLNGKLMAFKLPIMLSAIQGLVTSILAASGALPAGRGSLADKENMQSAVVFLALSVEAPFMMYYAIKQYPVGDLDGGKDNAQPLVDEQELEEYRTIAATSYL